MSVADAAPPIARGVLLAGALLGCASEEEGVDTGPDRDLDADGWTVAEGDCDDAEADVHPEAVEQPRNGVDENCDGTDAPSRKLDEAAAAVWWGTAPFETAGASVAFAGDVDGDGVEDVLVGAPSLGDEASQEVFLLAGPAAGGGALAEGALATVQRDPEVWNTLTFHTITGAGDLDDDGYADIALSDSRWGAYPGRVVVFDGPISGTYHAADADHTLTGTYSNGMFGAVLLGGADLDGDGTTDLAIGAESGLYLFPGPVVGDPTVDEAEARLPLFGETLGVAGDVNADGYVDVLWGYLNEHSYSGEVFLFDGPFGSDPDPSATFRGDRPGEEIGWTLAAAGDVDADGYDDFLFGGRDNDDLAGTAYLVLGPTTGAQTLSSGADASLTGEQPRAAFGWALSSAGALGGLGDGVLFGGVGGPGGVYLFRDPPRGVTDPAEADLALVGRGTGYSIAGGKDLDLDGVPDLLVGAPGDSEHGEQTGKVYVVSGASL